MNTTQDQAAGERLIRIAEVKNITGLSTASIYRKIAAKEFPRPVALGPMARAWPLTEVQRWITGRVSERDQQQ
jgi:prophage regulatory protein